MDRDSQERHNPDRMAEGEIVDQPDSAAAKSSREHIQSEDGNSSSLGAVSTAECTGKSQLRVQEPENENFSSLGSSATKQSMQHTNPIGEHTRSSGSPHSKSSGVHDYEEELPPDPPGKAMDPNSRVMRVYLEETEDRDEKMITNFKESVDVILLSAGLLSAVTSTFASSASSRLQLDYTQVVAALLVEQIALTRASAGGLAASSVPPATLGPDSTPSIARSDRWVNGLWFSSLTFSLATALFGFLVKQWMLSYQASAQGTARFRARTRHFRYTGVRKWKVHFVVGLLPIMLHIALLLLFLGLILFLSQLDQELAVVVTAITSLSYAAYITTTLIPVFDPQCPYKTPFSSAIYFILWNLSRLSIPAAIPAEHWLWHILDIVIPRKLRFAGSFPRTQGTAMSHMKERERYLMEEDKAQGDRLDADMLTLLYSTSSNVSVKSIILRAIPDLRFDLTPEATAKLRANGILDAICTGLHSSCSGEGPRLKVKPGQADKIDYLLRGHLRLVSPFSWEDGQSQKGIFECKTFQADGSCRKIITAITNQDIEGVNESTTYLKYTHLDPGAFSTKTPSVQGPIEPEVPDIKQLATMSSSPISPHLWISLLWSAVHGVARAPKESIDTISISDVWPHCKVLLDKLYFNDTEQDDLFECLQQVLIAAYLAHYVKGDDTSECPLIQGIDFHSSDKQLVSARAGYSAMFIGRMVKRFHDCKIEQATSKIEDLWWDQLEGYWDRVFTHLSRLAENEESAWYSAVEDRPREESAPQTPIWTNEWVTRCMEIFNGAEHLWLVPPRDYPVDQNVIDLVRRPRNNVGSNSISDASFETDLELLEQTLAVLKDNEVGGERLTIMLRLCKRLLQRVSSRPCDAVGRFDATGGLSALGSVYDRQARLPDAHSRRSLLDIFAKTVEFYLEMRKVIFANSQPGAQPLRGHSTDASSPGEIAGIEPMGREQLKWLCLWAIYITAFSNVSIDEPVHNVVDWHARGDSGLRNYLIDFIDKHKFLGDDKDKDREHKFAMDFIEGLLKRGNDSTGIDAGDVDQTEGDARSDGDVAIEVERGTAEVMGDGTNLAGHGDDSELGYALSTLGNRTSSRSIISLHR